MSRETLAERDREGRRPSCHCPIEIPNKPFGSRTQLAHETLSKGESAQRSGVNRLGEGLKNLEWSERTGFSPAI